MGDEREIHCHQHGPSWAAFACVHLANGGRDIGFCMDPDATEPWPDVTCDACDSDQAAREWTHEEAVANTRLICGSCWEESFERNARVERHRDPERFIHAAVHRAQERQDQWAERHGIGTHGHWQMQLDCEAPWLGFGESASRIHIRADALVIGSWSPKGKTWLWGWGNSNWAPELTQPFVALKRYGEKHGIEALWRRGGPATEDDAFALAAVALDMIPGIEGIYRAPSTTSLFLAVKNTQIVS